MNPPPERLKHPNDLKPFFREGHDEKPPTAGDAARCLTFFAC
jgi:hypothetical protein